MKALRYLLMMTVVLSVLSVSAQTPQYNTTYNPRNESAAYGMQANTQMPEATIGSTSSDFMTSGSTLPMAAANGTTLSETGGSQPSGLPGSIRRGRPGDWTDPYKDPLGDAAWPLLMLLAAYALLRVYKRKRSA